MRREAFKLDPDPVDERLAESIHHVSDFTFDRPVIDAVRAGRSSYRPKRRP